MKRLVLMQHTNCNLHLFNIIFFVPFYPSPILLSSAIVVEMQFNACTFADILSNFARFLCAVSASGKRLFVTLAELADFSTQTTSLSLLPESYQCRGKTFPGSPTPAPKLFNAFPLPDRRFGSKN
jgi:hypothetical protein